MITACEKIKRSGIEWKKVIYTYYHCTKKKKWIKCNQKYLKLDLLESQINDLLNSITILPQFKDWALKIIKRDFHKELEEQEKIKICQVPNFLDTLV